MQGKTRLTDEKTATTIRSLPAEIRPQIIENGVLDGDDGFCLKIALGESMHLNKPKSII